MAECVHRDLCPNECPCDYLVTIQETDYTELEIGYVGMAISYGSCKNCGQPVQYPRDRPFNCCPYCGRKINYKEETWEQKI
jgi:DNA-directed RNA polymerase subunit RPC12/RpoP